MSAFRVRFAIEGEHVKVRLYAASTSADTFVKCGDLVLRRGRECSDFFTLLDRNCTFVGDNDERDTIKAAVNAVSR